MSEIWKDIEGYEGIYQASNLGRVKSLERTFQNKHESKPRTLPERVLSPSDNKAGYLTVALSREGKLKYFYVHRLVLNSFTKNNCGKEQCNHKNGDKHDNRLENLEWLSPSDNLKHYYRELKHGKKSLPR